MEIIIKKLIIKATAEEIAALAVALQGQRELNVCDTTVAEGYG